jgi:hypothetical protein
VGSPANSSNFRDRVPSFGDFPCMAAYAVGLAKGWAADYDVVIPDSVSMTIA